MYLDVTVRLSNKFWARHFADTVALWFKCNSRHPFRWMAGKPEVISARRARQSSLLMSSVCCFTVGDSLQLADHPEQLPGRDIAVLAAFA